MSEPAAPEPNALDALAADVAGGPFTFTVGDRTGTIRPRLWGDLVVFSREAANGYLAQVTALLERCQDEVAEQLLAQMTPTQAMAVFNDWTAHDTKADPGK